MLQSNALVVDTSISMRSYIRKILHQEWDSMKFSKLKTRAAHYGWNPSKSCTDPLHNTEVTVEFIDITPSLKEKLESFIDSCKGKSTTKWQK